jgi:uncharacterized protein (DUF302 family)
MDLGYTKETEKGFDETVAKIEELTVAKGFKVLYIHNVQETLEGKGFNRGPFKIIEVCNAKFAHNALNIDTNVGLFMPCKINVYTINGKTVISAMRPAMISEFFSQPELKELAGEVDEIVRSIVDEAK